jgi:hypothetical protein
MLSAASLLGVLYLLAVLQTPEPPPPVSPATFVGTWVGLQTVADNTSPGVQEGQTVTMTIEMADGKLVGTLNPFFGGNDGARFVDVQIAGDELKASAVVGKAPVVVPAPPPAGGGGRGVPAWKSDTRIQFTLRADRTHLKGTADVELSGVKWMQYNYDLEKKRSRY